MNFLAGFVMLVMKSEQESFWVFVALIKALSRYFDCPKLQGVKKDLDHLSVLTETMLPSLYSHLKECGLVDFSLCFPKWLMCMCIGVLDTPCLLKVWDAFWCFRGDRRIFLQKLCLYMLTSNQEKLLSCENLADVYICLTRCGDHVCEVNTFLSGISEQSVDLPSQAGPNAANAPTPGSGRKRKSQSSVAAAAAKVKDDAPLVESDGYVLVSAPEETSNQKMSQSHARKQQKGEEGGGLRMASSSPLSLSISCNTTDTKATEDIIPMTPISKTLHTWIQNGTPLMRLKTIAKGKGTSKGKTSYKSQNQHPLSSRKSLRKST